MATNFCYLIASINEIIYKLIKVLLLQNKKLPSRDAF